MGRPLLLLVAATCCWGASSATLAHTGSRLAAGAPMVACGGAVLLCVLTALQGRGPLAAFRRRPGLYARLGALEAVNLALYVAALGLGPLPVMVALHLTSRVILIATDVVRGRRPTSVLVGAEIALIAGAIALVAVAVPEGSSTGDVLAGSVLALGSAVALAVLINQVAREAEGQDPDVAAGLQLTVAATLTAPLAIIAGPDAEDAARLLLAGLGLLGPGFALYWRALRGLDAPLAGILGLNEAVVASIVGAVAFGAAIGPATLGAAALILAAVALELGGGDWRLRQGLVGA